MPFPTTPLTVSVEVQISGVWTDVTADAYLRDPITISRGRADEGSRVDPGSCSLTLNNRSGKYSPRNPASPYYGQIGRNTPLRVSVRAGDSHLDLDGNLANYASTPDTAALDITGDLDLRAEISTEWRDEPDNQFVLAKWDPTGDQRSYGLRIYNNSLNFSWSPDGTAGSSMNAFWTLPRLPYRAAVRATLDVDNGAGGAVVALYWAESLDGPWNFLGQHNHPVTTSVFASTAPLLIGGSDPTTIPPRVPLTGEGHRFEVRSGIAGTVVAAPDFRALAPGTTSFTDSAGRAWTLSGTAAVTNRNTRFHGEVSSWPTRWDVSGKDVWVPVEAAGILRRLGQGTKPLDSTLRRRIPFHTPLAYWPLEEGVEATHAYSPIPGVAPLVASGFTWANNDTLPSSAPLPVLKSSGGTLPAHSGRVPAPSGAITGWQVRWLYRLDTAPATLRTHMRFLTTGTAAEWILQQRGDGSRLIGLDADGGTIFTQDIGTGSDLYGQWNSVHVRTAQNGGAVDWTVAWQDVGGDVGEASGSFTGAIGRITEVTSPSGGYSSDLDGMALGHIAVFGTTLTTAYEGAITAYAGESAWSRADRLASEEDVPLALVGVAADTQAMGVQSSATLVELLQQCADTDGGILSEQRERLGLRCRNRVSTYNQTPALALNYTAPGEVAPPLEPVDDDQHVRNDIEVERIGGSTARAVLQTGPLSTAAPPAGVGRYDVSVDLSLAGDNQAAPIANWLLHLGTWDEARYSRVHIDLAAAPHLINAAIDLEVRDRITIANPPAWLPPGPIDLLMEGYTETIGLYEWDLVCNCTPAGPWTVAVADDEELARADTTGSELVAAVDGDDTALTVLTTLDAVEDTPAWIVSAGPSTTYASQFPLGLRLGGEVVTATAAEPAGWDLYSRTLSNTWGTANSGQAWTETGGAASDRSVGSGIGVLTLAATPTDVRFQRLVPGLADAEVLVVLGAGQVSTGDSLLGGILLRYSSSTAFYRVRLHFRTDSLVNLVVTNGATEIGAQVATGLTYTGSSFFWLRARVIGQTVYGRVWAFGTDEPSAWGTVRTITSSTIDTGDVGLTVSAFSGITNVSPTVRYDGFEVVTPQRFTVTRSVNGVSKSHAAGTALSLAQPAVVAL